MSLATPCLGSSHLIFPRYRVIGAGVQVLKKLVQLDGSFELEFEDYDWSSETYKKTGKYIPDGGLEKLKKHDAILFGAVGTPGMCGD